MPTAICQYDCSSVCVQIHRRCRTCRIFDNVTTMQTPTARHQYNRVPVNDRIYSKYTCTYRMLARIIFGNQSGYLHKTIERKQHRDAHTCQKQMPLPKFWLNARKWIQSPAFHGFRTLLWSFAFSPLTSNTFIHFKGKNRNHSIEKEKERSGTIERMTEIRRTKSMSRHFRSVCRPKNRKQEEKENPNQLR